MPKQNDDGIRIHFSDYICVPLEAVEEAGASNVSLVNDLPLFIEPFVLFNSRIPEYQKLHDDMICYLCFPRDRSLNGEMGDGFLRARFMFSEVKQTWLGLSRRRNIGSGLGIYFARALNENLNTVFSDFGQEAARRITKGSHLGKLCLIGDRCRKEDRWQTTTPGIEP